MENNYLAHHGIRGMKWGVRRTPEQLGHRSEKKDAKWAKKHYDKIYNQAFKKSKDEAYRYAKTELAPKYAAKYKSGASTKNFAIEYNRKLAELMTTAVSDIRAPSGKTVKFVAKRGEIGVHMALADAGYDMSQLKNGVYGSGKIAYRNKNVDKV